MPITPCPQHVAEFVLDCADCMSGVVYDRNAVDATFTVINYRARAARKKSRGKRDAMPSLSVKGKV